MRTLVASFLLLAVAPVMALAQAGPAPPSAANLLRLHPGPWRMPVTFGAAAMRFEPESGEGKGVDEAFARSAGPSGQSLARARAAANVTRHADGSRHAVLGSAFRMWTVATIDDEGRLTQDCVSSAAEAKARVEAAARKQVKR